MPSFIRREVPCYPQPTEKVRYGGQISPVTVRDNAGTTLLRGPRETSNVKRGIVFSPPRSLMKAAVQFGLQSVAVTRPPCDCDLLDSTCTCRIIICSR